MLWREGEAVSPSLLEAAMEDHDRLINKDEEALLLLAGWKMVHYSVADRAALICKKCKDAGYYLIQPDGGIMGICPTKWNVEYATTAPNVSRK